MNDPRKCLECNELVKHPIFCKDFYCEKYCFDKMMSRFRHDDDNSIYIHAFKIAIRLFVAFVIIWGYMGLYK